MPRDAGGNYTLPGGNPVVTGTTIDTSWANPTMEDIAQALTNSLSRNGQGGMLVPFLNLDGTESNPGISWTLEQSTGFRRSNTGEMSVVILGNDTVRFNAGGIDVWDGSAWSPLVTGLEAVLTGEDSTIQNDVTIHGVVMPGNVAVPIIDLPVLGNAVVFGDATIPVTYLRGTTIWLQGDDIDLTGNVSLPSVDQLDMLNNVSVRSDNFADDDTIDLIAAGIDDIVYVGDVAFGSQLQGAAVNVVAAAGSVIISASENVALTPTGNLGLNPGGSITASSPFHTFDEFGHTIRDYASPTAAVNWGNGPMAYLAIAGATTITFAGETLTQRGTIILDPSADAAITWPAGAVWVGNPVEAVESGVPTIVNVVYDATRDVFYLVSGAQCSGSAMALATTSSAGALLKSNGGLSVVRADVGRYDYTLTTVAPDANYILLATCDGTGGNGIVASTESKTVNGFRVTAHTLGGSFTDREHSVQAIIF